METVNKAYSEDGLSEEMSFDEAKKAVKGFNTEFPKIAYILKKATVDVKNLKYALSPLDGRRRYLLNVDWDDMKQVAHAFNIAKNTLCQSLNASVTKLAMCYIRKRIKEEGLIAFLVNTVHDEVEVEALEEHATRCAQIVEESMIKAGKFYLKKVPVGVSIKIADHWVKD